MQINEVIGYMYINEINDRDYSSSTSTTLVIQLVRIHTIDRVILKGHTFSIPTQTTKELFNKMVTN